MERWTDNINGEPYTSRGVRTVRRGVFGDPIIVIWKGAGYLPYIAANRINYNGKNTADHFNNYARIGKFCRKMELELGLVITPEMHLTAENKDKPRQTADQALLKLKQAIDSILPNVSSMQQLSTELQKQGVKTFIKRGVTFINTKWIFRSMLGSSSILVKNIFKYYTLSFATYPSSFRNSTPILFSNL